MSAALPRAVPPPQGRACRFPSQGHRRAISLLLATHRLKRTQGAIMISAWRTTIDAVDKRMLPPDPDVLEAIGLSHKLTSAIAHLSTTAWTRRPSTSPSGS